MLSQLARIDSNTKNPPKIEISIPSAASNPLESPHAKAFVLRPAKTYEQTCAPGSPCAQGEGAQATLNQFGAPLLAMTDIQRDMIRDEMKPYAGVSLHVYCQSSPDAEAFTDQLVIAMNAAGLTADKSCSLMLAGAGGLAPYPGISMDITNDRLDMAKAFATALNNAKIVSKPIHVTPHLQSDSLFGITVTPNR